MICKVSLTFSGYQAAMISEKMLQFVLVLACLLLSSSPTLIYAQPFHNLTSKLPTTGTTWVNRPSVPAIDVSDVDYHTMTPILSGENTDGTAFVCGFYCNSGTRTTSFDLSKSRDCLFGVLISLNRNLTFQDHVIQNPRLVWSANRNDPVQLNATLGLSRDGDLILRDWDGRLAWSSNTGGKSVAGMNLTENGNLVLFGRNNEPIWQSFDYPTDTLLLGQELKTGQRLIASVSASNWSEGLFYLFVDSAGLAAYVKSNPPQRYFLDGSDSYMANPTFRFDNGSLYYYSFSSSARFMRLGLDGHLKVFQSEGDDWVEASDLLSSRACDYPMVCGTYGVCSDGQCLGCPEASGQGSFFTETNFRQPSLGCSLVRPISCDHSKDHTLLELSNTSYFASHSYKEDTLVDDCKNRCLRNCSCKAALFAKSAGGKHSRKGICSLLNEVFSIANNENFMHTLYKKLHAKITVLRWEACERCTSC